ncbi:methyl-accepting chemotaxis protein [Seohaeicola nanhaiensis]|uniref:Methyl-accepting chemotaxis protein n=1 Tax=Seohaeicola nanhaiensis TaxID=1387282 RepID=A0ABV9KMI3_9RHOB
MLDNLNAGRKILAVFAVFAMILLAGGAAVTWSFLRVTHNGLEVGEHLAPLGDAAMEVKLNAAYARLALEADSGSDAGRVAEMLDQAGFYIGAILDGASNAEGGFIASTAPEVRQQIMAVRQGLDMLRASATARLDLLRAGQGVGSAADEKFDELYEGLIEGISALAAILPDSAAAQHLTGEARFRLAHGHLIFEEIQGGDAGEDIDESIAAFTAAQAALQAAAPEFGGQVEPLVADVGALIDLAKERYSRSQARAAALRDSTAQFDTSFQEFIAAADRAEELVHDDMVHGIATLRTSAQMATISLSVAGAALLLAVFLAYHGLDRSFGRRLRQLSGCMQSLLKGELNVKAPDWRSTDEVGVLRDSIEEMRTAFLRQIELEKIAGSNRQAADAQRKTAEQQAALAEQGRAEAMERQREAQHRAATASRFAAEFGDLVRQATAGHFSARIAGTFDDPAFDQLAQGINEVMAAVERGLGETAQVLAAMARGKLSARMRGSYEGAFAELKSNANITIEKMGETVVAIDSVARSIVSGTEAIAGSSGEISRRTAAQADALRETDGTTATLSAKVAANSESTRRVASQAKLAADRAELGGEALRRTVTAIQQIDESAQKVKNIIDVIDDISFQTNLLALNAGVEAARAGDAGKGFAVVAQEVRQLAQRATEAAQDIGTLIEKSLRDVADGVHLVNETGDVLSEVLKAIAGVAEATQEITAANEEQSAGVTEINRRIGDIGRMTQQNAGIAETSAGSARDLAEQAHRLSDLLTFFQVAPEDGGRRAAA